ncbi:hypothetical protein CEXT_492251 [Caerostris extrusa]|uniref:Uncharacterized protein n=1 Tax=Caerostris extrusa TaxID=172846 RepID=A0AAV4TVJ0_CAEEX|nr:hypothetical protein CEXT_492251 [Caerostris extrusa]
MTLIGKISTCFENMCYDHGTLVLRARLKTEKVLPKDVRSIHFAATNCLCTFTQKPKTPPKLHLLSLRLFAFSREKRLSLRISGGRVSKDGEDEFSGNRPVIFLFLLNFV